MTGSGRATQALHKAPGVTTVGWLQLRHLHWRSLAPGRCVGMPSGPADPSSSGNVPTLQSLSHEGSAAQHRPDAAWVLQTEGLTGQRGDRTLFADLTIALPPGSVTWLRGRNGRGKTSLLRLLAGLSTPSAGVIRIAGRMPREAGAVWRRQLVYIGHQNALKDDLTVTEALRFLAQLHALPHGEEQLHQALRRMGIANRRHAPVRTLSQGQRRRVALARLALHGGSPLWLLDEPFDALDVEGIAALNAVIGEHAARGGCVLLTSHQALTLTSPVPQVLDLDAAAPAQRAS